MARRVGGLVSLGWGAAEGAGRVTCRGGRLRVAGQVEIQGCRATRKPRQHKLQAHPSTRPPWSACRPPVAVAEWWRGWAGGALFPPGCAADSSPPPCWPMQQLPRYLQVAARLGSRQGSAVPYSAFPSGRAARLALLAHRPRGFSPLPPSLFSTAAAPFRLPQPYPPLDHNLPVHHNHHTTHNTQPPPQSHNCPVPGLLLSSPRRQQPIVPWCPHSLQPGSEPRNSPWTAAAPIPAPAWRNSRWILRTSGVGLRPRSQSLPPSPPLQQLLPPPPPSLPLRPLPSRPSTVQSR